MTKVDALAVLINSLTLTEQKELLSRLNASFNETKRKCSKCEKEATLDYNGLGEWVCDYHFVCYY